MPFYFCPYYPCYPYFESYGMKLSYSILLNLEDYIGTLDFRMDSLLGLRVDFTPDLISFLGWMIFNDSSSDMDVFRIS